MNTLYIYRTVTGEFRWRFRSRNGRTLADSGEGYKRIKAALKAIESVFLVRIEQGDRTTPRGSGRAFRVVWQ